jgi:hypothetical protein
MKYPISQEGQKQFVALTNVVIFVNESAPGFQGLLAVGIVRVKATQLQRRTVRSHFSSRDLTGA